MLWPLVSPIFLGTFLALVAIIVLMGKAHKLTRGPRRAFGRMMYGSGCGGGCGCAKCRRRHRRWGRQVRLQQSQRPPFVPA